MPNKLILFVLFSSFIVIGLPSQTLSVAWPLIGQTFDKPLMWLGNITSFNSLVGILSATFSGYFIKKYTTGSLISFAAVLIASGTALYALSPSFGIFICAVVPVGVGSGFLNAAMNQYAAEKCSAKQMNWLHGFWGVGAAGGAFLMTQAVALSDWRYGYGVIALLQSVFVFIALYSKKGFVAEEKKQENAKRPEKLGGKKTLALCLFFVYGFFEAAVGVWVCSFLIQVRGLSEAAAGKSIVVFWGCLTLGRFFIGFVSARLGNIAVLKICLSGMLIFLPFLNAENITVVYTALALLGMSLCGMSPSMMYETPRIFGVEASKSFIGYQSAASSCGIVLLMPLLGVFFQYYGLKYLISVFFGFASLVAVLVFAVYLKKSR